jgi:hypothetical protein
VIRARVFSPGIQEASWGIISPEVLGQVLGKSVVLRGIVVDCLLVMFCEKHYCNVGRENIVRV